MLSINKLVFDIKNFDKLVPYLRQLGKEHVKFGVMPQHYHIFWQAFGRALIEFLGREANADIINAWSTAFKQISETMIGHNYDQNVTCELCDRQMPVFVVENDNMILRMPEQYMPKFLKVMKQDFLNKCKYL